MDVVDFVGGSRSGGRSYYRRRMFAGFSVSFTTRLLKQASE